jgi:hypothetical protein
MNDTEKNEQTNNKLFEIIGWLTNLKNYYSDLFKKGIKKFVYQIGNNILGMIIAVWVVGIFAVPPIVFEIDILLEPLPLGFFWGYVTCLLLHWSVYWPD